MSFQERMMQEARELKEKVAKLSSFRFTEAFKSMEDDAKALLIEQHEHMQNYLDVLQKRLEKHVPKPTVEARFTVDSVTEPSTTNGDVAVSMSAIAGAGSEDFTKYTPWGNIRFGLSGDAVNAKRAFTPGQAFRVIFEPIE